MRCRAIEESIKETKCLIPPSPPPMDRIDISGYAHSSIHRAVLSGDHADLRNILASIPQISSLPQTLTEAESMAEESKADVISSFIDRRDVPNRETPLHLAIKIGDASAVELLMAAGADCTLQNIHGWSSLHESICARDDKIAKIILWHYQISACIKWRRRLPRVVSAMNLMRDFYMEIEFHFESPLIPFISRLAPSDTYKIWKKGSNLRVDMTISGFDGLRIKRSEKSVLFLGKGSADGKVKPGSLCVISHKDKEVLNAMDGACDSFSDVELKQDVEAMRKTDVNRPGLDVTRATLHPQMTWRKKQRSEMVGQWKAKVYTMHHVVFSLKSRAAPGAINDDDDGEEADDRLGELLTEEEKKKLELAFKMDFSVQSMGRDLKRNDDIRQPVVVGKEEVRRVYEEGEFSKGLKPVLWLSSNFPLQTEELLPLLDVLASKVKAVRRLRELLTTKLPRGTFPVKAGVLREELRGDG